MQAHRKIITVLPYAVEDQINCTIRPWNIIVSTGQV
jgi:hypothetical protein